MESCKHINFLLDETNSIELIVCHHSMLSYPIHNHISVYVICLITDGIVNVTINNNLQSYKVGEVFVIPPYCPHSIHATQEYSMISLCIREDAIENVKFDIIKDSIVNMLDLIPAFDDQHIDLESMFQALSKLLSTRNPVDVSGTDIVNSVRILLESSPEKKISIDEMAQLAFISKYHFIRSFKQEVGLTPHQFQLQNRIRKAQRLLHKADRVTDVALSAGFCDQSHFIRQFERIVRLTPSKYVSACNTFWGK